MQRHKTTQFGCSSCLVPDGRFLLHVLPGGVHRIRHFGLLANPVSRGQSREGA
ncbi:transposase [Paraburkholderia sp. SIMBA_030]|uniref:transposase n=1 Tax=Paraburkholderia sp. SIMBA_030 TaxID=3085773 RepID=UPI003978BD5D